MKPHRKYSLTEYDPKWVDRFNAHARKIKEILGPSLLEIHHIGSTSVPGMVAKSNIDIEVVASNLGEVRQHSQEMAAAGYTPRGDYSHIGEEYFTEDASDGERLTSIHVFPKDHPDIRTRIIFRDYLRTHKKERDLYIATKQRAYSENAENYPGYELAKQGVIDAIIERSLAWSKSK